MTIKKIKKMIEDIVNNVIELNERFINTKEHDTRMMCKTIVFYTRDRLKKYRSNDLDKMNKLKEILRIY